MLLDFLKRLIGVNLSEHEKDVLKALRTSEVTSRKVSGRGSLTMNAIEITQTRKFREYTEKASAIVNNTK